MTDQPLPPPPPLIPADNVVISKLTGKPHELPEVTKINARLSSKRREKIEPDQRDLVKRSLTPREISHLDAEHEAARLLRVNYVSARTLTIAEVLTHMLWLCVELGEDFDSHLAHARALYESEFQAD